VIFTGVLEIFVYEASSLCFTAYSGGMMERCNTGILGISGNL
jgi:hypothetical protein